MKTAFVFAQVGDAQNLGALHNSLHGVQGVKTVYFLAGPTDVIMQVEYEDTDGLMATVGKIRAVQGVASTDTRIVLPV